MNLSLYSCTSGGYSVSFGGGEKYLGEVVVSLSKQSGQSGRHQLTSVLGVFSFSFRFLQLHSDCQVG